MNFEKRQKLFTKNTIRDKKIHITDFSEIIKDIINKKISPRFVILKRC